MGEAFVGQAPMMPVAIGLLVLLASVLYLVMSRNSSSKNNSPPASVLLQTKQRYKVTLLEKESLSHDVRRFRFGLPKKDMALGLPIGKHIKVFAPNKKGVKEGEWNGRPDAEAGREEIERKYTPVSSDQDRGYFELMLKVYQGGSKEQFPDGGKMSTYLDNVAVGDSIEIQGPFGLYTYEGRGKFTVMRKARQYKHVGMIAGGTGITPMLQVIKAALDDPDDTTKLYMLFANQTEPDIFLRDRLEALKNQHPDRFKVHYTLDRPPAQGWEYSTGFIDEKMVRDHLPAPSEDSVVLMCGPPPMIKFACRPNLSKVGHSEHNQIDF